MLLFSIIMLLIPITVMSMSIFTILVKDSDGYSKYASVVTNAKDGIYEELMAFNKNASLAYGECVLNGGFTAVKMDNVKDG